MSTTDRSDASVRSWPMFAGNPARDGVWLNVDRHERSVRAYGGEPVTVSVIEDPDGPYYGWIEADSQDGPVMIQPHASLFTMQFPYGPKAEVERGRGEVVRLRVERV